MSALSMADCQAESQCWRGISAMSGASGNRTRQAGMGDAIPSGTPVCSVEKFGIRVDEMSDNACHRLGRKG